MTKDDFVGDYNAGRSGGYPLSGDISSLGFISGAQHRAAEQQKTKSNEQLISLPQFQGVHRGGYSYSNKHTEPTKESLATYGFNGFFKGIFVTFGIALFFRHLYR
ncbi:MAG TPA: hypothetical protein PKA63_03695 [Oligoflexia bacterium]|nr:hypothetical protein [Oligoflexia bacterium]HMP47758.1 hypothetical protein [Oligoflexia bacterium]